MGTYNENTGGVSEAAACTACPQGYYCPFQAMTEGDNYPIPAGYYSTATGLKHARDSVTDCPTHHYCEAGSAAPTPCPATHNTLARGTYFPGTNAEALEDCLQCPLGEWCNYFDYYSNTALVSYNHATAEASYRGEC